MDEACRNGNPRLRCPLNSHIGAHCIDARCSGGFEANISPDAKRNQTREVVAGEVDLFATTVAVVLGRRIELDHQHVRTVTPVFPADDVRHLELER